MTRIERDRHTVALMIGIYCNRRHGSPRGIPCPACSRLLDYATRRIEHCPMGEAKRSCRRCAIHCYAPAEREAIREVMRTVGPRMLLTHPVAALRHLLHELP